MSATRYAQFCALARAAEILGERWTLLVIRELSLGQKRFGDLAVRLGGDWVLLGLDAITRKTPTPARKIVLRVRHKTKAASFLVEGGPAGTTIAQSEGPGGAAIEARFDTLLRIISTQLPLDQAISDRLADVEGSLQVARVLPRLFDLSDRVT